MAKENSYPPVLYFITSALLLAAGAMFPSFPILIFFGLAPLFALTDRANDTTTVFEKMEWVLLSLTVYFLAIRSFDLSYFASAMVYAIVFTLPFIGHVWVRQTLGPRAGKITIILLWLAAEYVFLKIRSVESNFLADTLRLHPDWMKWNIHTGYLGGSLWVLLTNLIVYQTVFSKSPFRWYWIILTSIFLFGPAVYSHFVDFNPITRQDLVILYNEKLIVEDVTYLARGEFVVRTAAWISTLILLFTFVKSLTTK
ncbi:MAG: hypothetical protein WDN75_03870 [Bacteroidota bacterium]